MSTPLPRDIVAKPLATAATATAHWAQQIGEKHGERDRAVSLQEQSRIDFAYERQAACLQRWPAVVAAVKVLVACYNEGTGLDTLTAIEDAVSPTITLVSLATGRGSLTMTLEGAEVSVHTRDGQAVIGSTRWVHLDRTDEQTAEYLVRNWMEQL